MPLMVWLFLVMCILVLFTFPPLTAAQLMLLVDRYLGAHFFDAQAGGSAVLWMHFFWVFGHPEVYVLALPAYGFISDCHGAALVSRIHHCIADGIALIGVMLKLTDASPVEPEVPEPVPAAEPERASETLTGPDDDEIDLWKQMLAPFTAAAVKAIGYGGKAISAYLDVVTQPERAAQLARVAGSVTAEVAQLIAMPDDSPTRFKGKPGIDKRVAWAEPLPLDDVKTVGRALDASVNDLLLSCVAGALRDYLIEHGDDVDALTLRALVPVNLRPMEKAYKLGNRFGLVFLDLPVGIENPIERLYAVRANMRALKNSYQPLLAFGLLAAMGSGPVLLQDAMLQALARNATAVMTNVPGPQAPLWLAGERIDSLMFWVPQAGDIGLGVSILSYNGSVRFGVVADRGLCPDPDRISARFGDEYEKIVLATLLSPWPRDGDLDPDVAAQAVAPRPD